MGKALIIIGLGAAFLGVVLTWAPGAAAWFGRLPGDIRIERPGLNILVPITSCILVSLGLSVLLRLFR